VTPGRTHQVTPERVREFDEVVGLVRFWAERQPDVQALGLAGPGLEVSSTWTRTWT
jgi:hypothetical protein